MSPQKPPAALSQLLPHKGSPKRGDHWVDKISPADSCGAFLSLGIRGRGEEGASLRLKPQLGTSFQFPLSFLPFCCGCYSPAPGECKPAPFLRGKSWECMCECVCLYVGTHVHLHTCMTRKTDPSLRARP